MNLCLAYSHFYQQCWDSKNLKFFLYEVFLLLGVYLSNVKFSKLLPGFVIRSNVCPVAVR